MQILVRTFFRGLLAFLPIFITIYSMYYFIAWLNQVCNRVLAALLPGLPDLPGLGIALALVAIFALGALVSSRLTRGLYRLVEAPLRNLPVVKELYAALKQLTTLFASDNPASAGQVVSIRHPDLDATMVGIRMRSDVEALDDDIASGDMIAVYLPMSYQIGGFTLFVPRQWTTEIDLSVEAAMRNALTGWVKDDDDMSSPRPGPT